MLLNFNQQNHVLNAKLCSVVGEKEEADPKPEGGESDVSESKESFFNQAAPIDISPLWDMNVRDSVTSSKIPDHQINKMRSQVLAFERVIHIFNGWHPSGFPYFEITMTNILALQIGCLKKSFLHFKI